MLKLVKIIVVLLSAFSSFSQSWTWTSIADLPFATSNNALCEAVVNGNEFVYSFGGIDTTKIYSGIHQRCFKYDVGADSWSEIDSLPDLSGKIASAASFVKGKIYIIGGYHVLASSSEISSNKVHVYNPTTDSFETDATPIPIAIDDHVQCVYKDSLIFVVTGWSNTNNVPNVQIFNPELNQWQAGTNTNSNAFFTSFGASGTIIGDTIYYYGGAGGGSFAARKYMRKGYIDPIDPTNITWTLMDDAPGVASYRAACSNVNDVAFWIGGSSVSYNYDGIAYNGSGGVAPSARILHFYNGNYLFSDDFPQEYGVMDLRGIAKLSNNRFVIAGGMDSSQVVTQRSFLLQVNSLGLNEIKQKPFSVIYSNTNVQIATHHIGTAVLVDMSGRIVKKFNKNEIFTIEKNDFRKGMYFFVQNEQSIRIQL